jgi:predicted GTPase
MGAAGRDFHNFNMVYRDDPSVEVVAFTAAQIPGIADRRYPPSLAGAGYPKGIPIVDEAALEKVCRQHQAEIVVFAYSDVSHAHVMHAASRALSVGADFALLGPHKTMLRAQRPVIAVTAVRTGCGKSQTARYLAALLRGRDLRVAVIRHPMPYGDLEKQRVQRFASRADIKAAQCSYEEREEYEPHIAAGNVVYAGVDYAAILVEAEREADILIWDGGNNDFAFVMPDLHIVLADATRPGQSLSYYPGEAVLRMANVVVVNKVDSADFAAVEGIVAETGAILPRIPIVRARSPVTLDDPAAVRGRRVLVIEDGPTITHGGQPHGAGYVAAVQNGAGEIVDPRPYAVPALQAVFERYPHIGSVLPNIGYNSVQQAALRETIARAPVDVVIVATPIETDTLIPPDKTAVRARYAYADDGEPRLAQIVERFLDAYPVRRGARPSAG